jgi:hypothetical protein
MKHQFIDDQRRRYGVRRLCASLDISRSGYYAARRRPPSEGSVRRTGLTSKIQVIHDASRQTYSQSHLLSNK